MSQTTSPTAIGAFVLGAIVLSVAALLTFGSSRFLQGAENYTLYFQGNAKGLTAGAPVSFRGVRFGTVKQITLISDLSTDQVLVEVVVEVLPESFRNVQSQPGVDLTAGKDVLEHLIEDLGLRGKLALQSLVTGQLYIEFDYYPGSALNLLGLDSRYPELPTLPSDMEELEGTLYSILQDLEALPIQDLTDQLIEVVKGIHKITSSQNFKNTPELVNEVLVNMRDLTAKLNEQVPPLAEGLTQTSQQATATLTDVSTLLQNDQRQVVRLAESLERAATQATAMLDQTDEVIADLKGSDLQALILELSEAARAIRGLASYLERHPEALLRGKY